jgi:hypothetical protein
MPFWNKVKDFFTGFQQGSVHLPFIQPKEESKDVLIIDRKTWWRGQPSALLGAKGRCCLGFYCQLLNVPDGQMDGIGNPTRFPYGTSGFKIIDQSWLSMPEHKSDFGLWVSPDNILLTRYNDCEVGKKLYQSEEVMTEEIRERKIAEVFARHGVIVRFEN